MQMLPLRKKKRWSLSPLIQSRFKVMMGWKLTTVNMSKIEEAEGERRQQQIAKMLKKRNKFGKWKTSNTWCQHRAFRRRCEVGTLVPSKGVYILWSKFFQTTTKSVEAVLEDHLGGNYRLLLFLREHPDSASEKMRFTYVLYPNDIF